ncbi:MAG: hypothetical protein II670_05675, partial [Alphaproteobacteria bacterium]|nr:hypothetical protein [Alphaproteobacteria bacterium]
MNSVRPIFENMGLWDVSLIVIAAIIVAIVLVLQYRFYKGTKEKIDELASFFPDESNLTIKESSITMDILSSKAKMEAFLKNPPSKHIEVAKEWKEEENNDETMFSPKVTEYIDVNLISAKNVESASFEAVVNETNAYLCKNVGSSADFILIQDICERKIESLESQISNSLNVPLYLGLAGTFVGIIIGLIGIATNVNSLFGQDANLSSLTTLLAGVVIAMFASLFGLGLMVRNSAINYKQALVNCNMHKNGYYDFIRRELMPVLSNSMASSLNSLKSVLGEFIGKFGHNLTAYANSAELLNDNIEKQHLLLVEINKMNQTQVAAEIAKTFATLKNASESLNVFNSYQQSLNETVEEVNSAVKRIDDIVETFDDFSKSLKLVVENQGVAADLQKQFSAAIETHFPTGSEAREMWRKQFDELTTDASSVSEELNRQLKA